MKSKLRALLVSTALAASLAGCWHVPVSALWRLRTIDALVVDPAGPRLAARAPDWLEAPPGHVHVKVTTHAGEADEQELVIDLVEAPAPGPRGLAGEAREGMRITVFRASAADAARLREIQQRARAEKAAGANHRGKLLFYAEPCRRIDPPPGPAPIDLYLSLGEQGEFFKIYDDVDLRDPAVLGGALETAVPLCGKTAKRAQ